MPLALYVLRHAKAEEALPGKTDPERGLTPKGQRAAALVGRALANLEEAPERVLCSPARRARETLEKASEAGRWNAVVEFRPTIYEAGAEGLFAELRGVPPPTARLLLVGHQPGLSLLIAALTGSEPDFPAGSLARLDLTVASWAELAPASACLAWLFPPEVIAAVRRR